MKEAGECLTTELESAKIAALSIYEIIGPEGFALAETKGDSHAGELETSAVLYLAPELVEGEGEEGVSEVAEASNSARQDEVLARRGVGRPVKSDSEEGRRTDRAYGREDCGARTRH